MHFNRLLDYVPSLTEGCEVTKLFFFFAHLFLRDLMEPVLVAEQCVTTGQFTWQLTGGNDILNEVNRKKPRN